MSHRRCAGLVLASALLAAIPDAAAQTACRTPNCVLGALPAPCQNRAEARRITVDMTTSGLNFVFVPQNPKIEPGDCIDWRALTVTHNSGHGACPDDSLCGSPSPSSCLWDTGNVASGASPIATCAYDPLDFPSATSDGYYCRIHATPTTGTMRGTLQVTTDIVLSVDKDLGSGAVVLTWTGGGVTGDETFRVAKGTQPTLPLASTQFQNPAARTLVDAGELGQADTHFYLVRNRQANE